MSEVRYAVGSKFLNEVLSRLQSILGKAARVTWFQKPPNLSAAKKEVSSTNRQKNSKLDWRRTSYFSASLVIICWGGAPFPSQNAESPIVG